MIHGILGAAANIKGGDNQPPYTVGDFLSVYPQFKDILPNPVIETYVELGNQCVSRKRYHAMWKAAIGLFIAHFCALHLQSQQPEGASAAAVLGAAATAGVVTSESADGVSHSMDLSALTQDLNGWAGFKLTTFGVQFATLGKMAGKGGMYVW